ncbi:MAG: glutathione S-transferase C-terminal domain-containing protein, partial [Pseudomonadota bacterium]
FYQKNPMGGIPVLELDDGTCISESVAICRYFEETNPEPRLYGDDPKSIALIEAWIRRIEIDCYYPGTEILRNSSPAFENRAVAGLDNTPQIPALVERGRKRVVAFYDQFNAHLDGREFIIGERFSAADIVALCTVDFLEQYAGFAISPELAALAAWYEGVSARPSAKA